MRHTRTAEEDRTTECCLEGLFILHRRASGTSAAGLSGSRETQAQTPPSTISFRRRIKHVPASNTETTPRHDLLPLSIIDAELSGPVASSSAPLPPSFLSLCISPGL
ncbi:hypothetical protein Q5P01_005191 [Channa striata]|uniref:Uncharacterized protein n=1 Tax=Channa striata TaxID=64152 RepID=A0AA88NIR0_CHASR|nr:hypothetical protein Q5P01_005191 [Channa striata]